MCPQASGDGNAGTPGAPLKYITAKTSRPSKTLRFLRQASAKGANLPLKKTQSLSESDEVQILTQRIKNLERFVKGLASVVNDQRLETDYLKRVDACIEALEGVRVRRAARKPDPEPES